MAFTPLRSVKATGALCVKGLTPVFLGLVFGSGSVVIGRQKTALSRATVLAANSGVRVAGLSVESVGQIRSFGVLVPGAMGQVPARYRESAFSIGCQIKNQG